jgi:plastocyanin
MKLTFALATLGVFFASPVLAQTGSLKLRVVYGGDVPKGADIAVTADKQYCGNFKLTDESLVVNPENKGIQNVVLHVHTTGRGGTKLKSIPPPKNQTKVLDNKGCRFEPRVVILQVGDTLKISNSDDIGHNANMGFIEGRPINIQIAAHSSHDEKIEKAEPGLMGVSCGSHPWMKASFVAFDHPYAAVSDKNGLIEIKDLPTEKLTFRMIHETAKYEGITVGGKPADWKKNVFELTIKPGENDLGDVVIPAF